MVLSVHQPHHIHIRIWIKFARRNRNIFTTSLHMKVLRALREGLAGCLDLIEHKMAQRLYCLRFSFYGSGITR